MSEVAGSRPPAPVVPALEGTARPDVGPIKPLPKELIDQSWLAGLGSLRAQAQGEGLFSKGAIRNIGEQFSSATPEEKPKIQQEFALRREIVDALKVADNYGKASARQNEGKGSIDQETGDFWYEETYVDDADRGIKTRRVEGNIHRATPALKKGLERIAQMAPSGGQEPQTPEERAGAEAREALKGWQSLREDGRFVFAIVGKTPAGGEPPENPAGQEAETKKKLQESLNARLLEYAQHEDQSPLACILTVYALNPPPGLEGQELEAFRALVLQGEPKSLQTAESLLGVFVGRQIAAQTEGGGVFSGKKREKAKELYGVFSALTQGGREGFPLDAILGLAADPGKARKDLPNIPGITPDQVRLLANLSRGHREIIAEVLKPIIPQNVAALKEETLPQLTDLSEEQTARASGIFTLLEKAEGSVDKAKWFEAWHKIKEKGGGSLGTVKWIALILAMLGLKASGEGMAGGAQAEAAQ